MVCTNDKMVLVGMRTLLTYHCDDLLQWKTKHYIDSLDLFLDWTSQLLILASLEDFIDQTLLVASAHRICNRNTHRLEMSGDVYSLPWKFHIIDSSLIEIHLYDGRGLIFRSRRVSGLEGRKFYGTKLDTKMQGCSHKFISVYFPPFLPSSSSPSVFFPSNSLYLFSFPLLFASAKRPLKIQLWCLDRAVSILNVWSQ